MFCSRMSALLKAVRPMQLLCSLIIDKISDFAHISTDFYNCICNHVYFTLQGLLVLSSKWNSSEPNEFACDPVTPVRNRVISGYPWVLLIRRGNCEFADKVSVNLFLFQCLEDCVYSFPPFNFKQQY